MAWSYVDVKQATARATSELLRKSHQRILRRSNLTSHQHRDFYLVAGKIHRMSPSEITAILGIVVGIFTYAYSQYAEYQRKLHERRIEAYIEFIESISCASNRVLEYDREGSIRSLNARTKILLFGGDTVIEALAKLQNEGISDFSGPPGRENYLSLLREFRKDARGRFTSDATVAKILLDPPTQVQRT